MIQGIILGREGSISRKPGDVSGLEDAANGALAHRRKRAPAQLSEREIEIMQCLRKGKSNQEIGRSLAISAYTVKNHLQRIFRKLAVFNRTHAVSKFFMADQAPEA
jgi:DNA-binding CsgD family transcriptional regulator